MILSKKTDISSYSDRVSKLFERFLQIGRFVNNYSQKIDQFIFRHHGICSRKFEKTEHIFGIVFGSFFAPFCWILTQRGLAATARAEILES